MEGVDLKVKKKIKNSLGSLMAARNKTPAESTDEHSCAIHEHYRMKTDEFLD